MLSDSTEKSITRYLHIFLSRRQGVQSGARLVTGKETVVMHAFMKKRMLLFWLQNILSSVLLYSSHRVVFSEYWFYSEKLFMFNVERFRQAVSFQQAAGVIFQFLSTVPSSTSSFTRHCAAPWKTCAIPSLWVLTEEFLKAWKTSVVLFPGLPPTS